ncbi:hypothetical protein Ccrd_008890 [Cynara cardunculus var. scolymus]|uniref:Uncharacterized protein n=1 Tax=Cynara cardunculus var. scolymus TaxID=59895 RepID=A0A103XE89_CYNCS|nr:hypothetical protein Ccrd_008890 [Cynara cardunculus var. scolymus]
MTNHGEKCAKVVKEVLNEPVHVIPLQYLETRRERLRLPVEIKIEGHPFSELVSRNPVFARSMIEERADEVLELTGHKQREEQLNLQRQMFWSHMDRISKMGSSKELLLSDPVSELDGDGDGDGDGDVSEQILYAASFEEFASSIIMYDTIIWVSISLLLVLAWGVGVIMLLYLPMRRYVLSKDLSSRELYVTPSEVVYKVIVKEASKVIQDAGRSWRVSVHGAEPESPSHIRSFTEASNLRSPRRSWQQAVGSPRASFAEQRGNMINEESEISCGSAVHCIRLNEYATFAQRYHHSIN